MTDADTDSIELQAVRWRVRQDHPQWSEQDQQALDAWLDASVAHRVAWLRTQYGWQRVDRLSALRTPVVDLMKAAPASRRPRRWMAWAAAMVLTLGAAVSGAVYWQDRNTQRYETVLGGHEAVALKDGSRVELNTDTRIRTAVDDTARKVWLDRGQAYFDIKRDPARPFVVEAGEHRIVVLGTRFSVRREQGRLEVVVEDGRVQVEEKRADGLPKVTVAGRGDRVIAEVGSMLLAPSSPEKVAKELSWRHGVLVFDKSTLVDVATEFNRYNGRKLMVDPATLGDVRISGSFDATNVDAFARLLQRAYGLHVSEHGEQMVVSN